MSRKPTSDIAYTYDVPKDLQILMIGVLPLWDDRGDSIHLREIALALQKHGVIPTIVCQPSKATPKECDLQEVCVSFVPKRFLRQISWNINGSLAAIKSARRFNASVIYTRLDPGIIVGLITSLITRKPLVVEMNGLPTEDIRLYRPSNKLLLLITRLWESTMYKYARNIVGAPGYVKYVKEKFGVPVNKFWTVPLGVNTELYAPKNRLDCCTEVGLPLLPTVVWSGGFTGWQGLDTLISACNIVHSSMPEVRFILVGDGSSRDECQREVSRMGLEDVIHFTGRVDYSSVPTYIGASNVCVATFPGNRGKKGTISALKTLTYLSCGRPVITTDMDELGESIQSSGSGFMVPSDDPSALALKICQLLTESQEQWECRCDNAAKMVREHRSWNTIAGSIASNLREFMH